MNPYFFAMDVGDTGFLECCGRRAFQALHPTAPGAGPEGPMCLRREPAP
jgi:hypothetical protein